MTPLLMKNARICAPDGVHSQGWVFLKDGIIAEMGWEGVAAAPRHPDAECIDLGGRLLAPGLIDIHTHGAVGIDTMDADLEGLQKMMRFYAKHGVTLFLATTMTAPQAKIDRALATIAAAMQAPSPGAKILGAHVEGPYLNRKKGGAQRAEDIRLAEIREYTPLIENDVVRLITLAPEYPENLVLATEASRQGIKVAAGHTCASYEEMSYAVARGISQVTHLFNGMESLHHREPGAVGAALTIDALYCQLIADKIHIKPEVLRLAARAKGMDRIILISDAMRGTGMPDGVYKLGGTVVTVEQGVARTPSGALAGSTLTLERAVANMAIATGRTYEEILPMATRVPAEAMGLKHKGQLRAGWDADLIVLDAQYMIEMTMVNGKIVYDRAGRSDR